MANTYTQIYIHIVFAVKHRDALISSSWKERLTLKKCGKNGDQIQRLFQSPADLFIIQYNGEIDERVIEECRQKVKLLRTEGNPNVLFSLMDGTQTARLLEAYRDIRS